MKCYKTLSRICKIVRICKIGSLKHSRITIGFHQRRKKKQKITTRIIISAEERENGGKNSLQIRENR